MFFKGSEIFSEKFKGSENNPENIKGSENNPENIKGSENFPLAENKGSYTFFLTIFGWGEGDETCGALVY